MAPFAMQAQGAWATPQAAAALINALAAAAAPGAAAGSQESRPGDWTCPSCGANVFASKSSCFKCGATKSGGGGYGGGGGGFDSGGGLSEMAQMVRIGQRKSRPFKATWEAYCSMNGATMHDPAKHDDQFITTFLDSLGTLGMERMGMGGMGGMGLKRGFDQMSGMGGMGGMQKRPNLGTDMSDPVKAQLVEAVKKFQKEHGKVAWHALCDTELGGSRDPSRHSPEILKAFLDQQGVPVQIVQLDMSNTPQKMHCVQRVKNFQKEGADKKEVWHQYCDAELGGNRDPSRHSAEALQNFLDIYVPQ